MTATLSQVLAPDAAIPRRDAVLHPQSFADALAEYLGRIGRPVQVTAGRRLRARYHVGRSLRVLHEVDVDEKRFLVAARTFPRDPVDIARKARDLAVPTRALPPVIPLLELGAVAWVYPNDRKLKGLAELATTIAALIERDRVELELVSWAPERSVTVRCETPHAYAKAYAEPTAAREHRFHEELGARLGASDEVTIPRVLASGADVLVVEAGAGRSLATADSSDAVRAYARYGRALARLHSLAPPPDAESFERFEPVRLGAAAALIGRARPDAGDAATTLARELAERRPERATRACLHGDAHPKNVLDDGARITLIDLEQVSAGAAVAEIGSVLAVLGYRALTGRLDEETAERCRNAFLEAYGDEGPLARAPAIAWHTAAALLTERALRAITRVRDDGLHCLPAVLRLAKATFSREGA